MTFATVYAWSENFILPISHDEVVHGKGALVGKMPGDDWQRRANVRALLAFMWAHPGKQLLFMGCELAQETEWSEQAGLDWGRAGDPRGAGVQRLVRDLNRVYRQSPALWALDPDPDGFRWLTADDAASNTFAFVRTGDDSPPLVCVVNFAAVPHEGYRVGLPAPGRWREVINTDAEEYGGSGVGNLGRVTAEAVGWHGMPFSVPLRLPPLGALWLIPDRA